MLVGHREWEVDSRGEVWCSWGRENQKVKCCDLWNLKLSTHRVY